MWRRLFSTQNVHTALIYRILIILMLYSVSRVVFLAFNYDYFQNLPASLILKAFAGGIRFDLSAIIITNAFFILLFLLPIPIRSKGWYQKTAAWIFYIINAITLLANCLDSVYFKYSMKRSTADIFSVMFIGEGGDFFRLLPRYLLDFWYIFLVWGGLIFLMVFLYRKTISKSVPKVGKVMWYYLRQSLYFIAGLILCVILSRGGLQLRPLGIISAGEIARAQSIPLVLNTPFSIINTIGGEKLEFVQYYKSEAELNKVFNPHHISKGTIGKSPNINVIIIILESFSREDFATLNPELENGSYSGYCPFMDSLMQYSFVMNNAYANGKKSIEGLPAVIASLPNLMENPYVTSPYAGNPVNGLPQLLKKDGYSSAFFHGGTNGTMQFDAFASVAGFDRYYGRTEYNNEADYDGNWGIFDEEFLQYTAQEINGLKQPFVATIFTLSSHHPYTIPPKYKGKFPKGTLEIHESIGYTDYSISQFFKTASSMPWFSNTLFVFTADHSSLTFSDKYRTNAGKFAIPIFFYRGDGSMHGSTDFAVQQTDILPSVLDYLDYSGEYIAFGNSVFNDSCAHFGMWYYNNVYQMIKDDISLEFNGEKSLSAFNLREDPLMQSPLGVENTAEVKAAENFVKAVIQSYQGRVINNQLIIRK